MLINQQKKHKSIDKRPVHKEQGFIYPVRIRFNNEIKWNEICANIVEVFGLPGHRFVSEVNIDDFKIIFKSKKDKIMCEMLLSEHL